MAEITTFSELCKGMEDCGICAFICPEDIFHPSSHMNQYGYIVPELINVEDCIGCLNCMMYCPDFAIVAIKDNKNKKVGNG